MTNEFECFWYVDGTHDDWPMTIEADGLDLKSITIPVQYENGESEVLRFVPERTCSNTAEDGFECSECHSWWIGARGTTYPTLLGFKRCPNCGAKVVDE